MLQIQYKNFSITVELIHVNVQYTCNFGSYITEKKNILNNIGLYNNLLSELKIKNESKCFKTLKKILNNMKDLNRREILKLS